MHRTQQSGFTLIDLLVGLVIGLIALAAMGSMYVASSRHYTTQEASARLQESGRIAMEMIMRDLRMAGYLGCAEDIENIYNHAVDTNTGTRVDSDLFDFRFPIEYLDSRELADVGTLKWYPSATSTTLTAENMLENTGAFKIKGLDPNTSIAITQVMVQPSGVLHVEDPNDLQKGQLIGVTDCQSADIFAVSTKNPAGTGTLGHTTGEQPGYPYQNDADIAGKGCSTSSGVGNRHCLSKVYDTDAQIMRFNAARYYIATGTNGPALFRQDIINGTNEFVPGIENLTILWGVDTDSDRIPDEYQRGYVANWKNVVSARVSVLARTQAQTKYGTAEEVGGNENIDTKTYDLDGDGVADTLIPSEVGAKVQRKLFTSTVLLRNIQ